jgi:hypothetical protein
MVGFCHGTGWEADDRQGDRGGVFVRPAALSLSCVRDGSPPGGDASCLAAPFTTARRRRRRYQTGRSRHFFVLAPNTTIYDKLVADFTQNTAASRGVRLLGTSRAVAPIDGPGPGARASTDDINHICCNSMCVLSLSSDKFV